MRKWLPDASIPQELDRNLWYVRDESVGQGVAPNGGPSKDGGRIDAGNPSAGSGRQSDDAGPPPPVTLTWHHLLGVALTIDALLLIYRLLHALDRAQQILNGAPVIIDCTRGSLTRNRKGETIQPDWRIKMKRTFVTVSPGIGGGVPKRTRPSCLADHGVGLRSAGRCLCFRLPLHLPHELLLPRPGLRAHARFGWLLRQPGECCVLSVMVSECWNLFLPQVLPVHARHRLVNTHIATQAERANQVELAHFERSANARFEQYQFILSEWRDWLERLERSQCEQLLLYKERETGVPRHCEDFDLVRREMAKKRLTFEGCSLEKVQPRLFEG